EGSCTPLLCAEHEQRLAWVRSGQRDTTSNQEERERERGGDRERERGGERERDSRRRERERWLGQELETRVVYLSPAALASSLSSLVAAAIFNSNQSTCTQAL